MRVLFYHKVTLLKMGDNPSWEMILIRALTFCNFLRPPLNWSRIFHRARNLWKGRFVSHTASDVYNTMIRAPFCLKAPASLIAKHSCTHLFSLFFIRSPLKSEKWRSRSLDGKDQNITKYINVIEIFLKRQINHKFLNSCLC